MLMWAECSVWHIARDVDKVGGVQLRLRREIAACVARGSGRDFGEKKGGGGEGRGGGGYAGLEFIQCLLFRASFACVDVGRL